MPPQTGMFPIPPYAPGGSKDPMGIPHQHHNAVAGPSSRAHNMGGGMDEVKKDNTKKRKEISGKLGKEMNDRRDDGRHYNETVSALQRTAMQLSTRPETLPLYELRLLPLSLERSALLVQLETEEKHAMDCAHLAYEEERQRVEDEWRRGRDRVRERLLEGIEERRRRAREEKEGEGTVGDASMEQSRPHITRKLRNKMGTSPPPTPLGAPGSTLTNGTGLNPGLAGLGAGLGLISSLPITAGPFLNPHSLAVDEIPSPFPLPLTATAIPGGGHGHGHAVAAGGAGGALMGGGGGGGPNGRRRPKGSGTHLSQAIGGLGKSLAALTGCKESEIENDLVEIRRANKRRRAAQGK
ncbi:hypothetical protein C8F04DRAFT_1027093 [Mycena alexandri]|uniref:Uncharacterized protein n=1 Tax=Mycena alexandri TaxID=1745969 RepID=A0AAD6TGG2_9AGAR|nr:hypothetical protein C8F04DRAFT_1027093 [Mycena alexandri]